MNPGLHFIYPLHSPELSFRDKEILSIVKPAGVFLDARSFAKEDPNWIEKFSKLRLEVSNAIGRKKIIFAIDHEGGRINRLPSPVSRTPAAGAYANYADEIGKIHGQELSALGINLNFAPVADINSNPSNPVIGPRAFGNTPEIVSAALSAYTKALQDSAVFATWKHFPGHGDTETDSHHSFPVVHVDQAELEARELKAYQNLKTAKVSALMTAHVLYPAADTKLPASLSTEIISGILRKKLDYQGIVITDDLDMRAITENFSDSEVIKYFAESGGDLMLFNHNPERLLKCFEILKNLNVDLEASEARISAFIDKLEDVIPLKAVTPNFFIANQEKINALSVKTSKLDYFGSEPKPADLKAPKKKFKVRIGIVLAEDKKSLIKFRAAKNSVLIDRGSKKINLHSDAQYEISIDNNQLYFFDGINKEKIETIATVKTSEILLTPECGTTVDNIVAGRHFHWRKEISETFPGDLEFIPCFDRIVLVNIVDFEDYVTCVVGSEMSGKNLPDEFAKAQAIAARTWSYVFMGNKYPGEPYTLCNDDMSQRYQGSSHISAELINIISETKGEFLSDPEGYLCPCFYSKSTGGHGELSENCFGFKSRGIGASFDCPADSKPSLNLSEDQDFTKWLETKTWHGRKIFCSPEIVPENELKKFIGAVDENNSYFRWNYKLSADLLTENLINKFGIKAKGILNLIPGPRGISGRYLNFTVAYKDENNTEKSLILPTQFAIRAAFHQSFLFSSAFNFGISKNQSGEISEIAFDGAGWGHGVGLCQIGALGMALLGYKYQEILSHYFSNTNLTTAY